MIGSEFYRETSSVTAVASTVAYGLLLSFWFLFANIAIGKAIFRIPPFAKLEAPVLTRVLFQFSLGTYATSTLIFVAAAAGHLRRLAVPLAFLLAGFLIYEGWRSRNEIAGLLQGIRERPIAVAASVAIVLWLVPFGIRAVLPTSDWDSLMYHLPNAARLLQLGIWSADPYSQTYDFPATWALLVSFFLALGSMNAGSVFSLLVGGFLSLLLIFDMTRRVFGIRPAVIAVLLFLSANVTWSYVATYRVDNLQAFYFTLATYGLLLFLDKTEPGWLVLAAISSGMLIGQKYTGIVLVAVIAFIPLLAWRQMVKRQMIAPLMLSIGVVAFPSAFWYARNWIDLGDPVYPIVGKNVVYIDGSGRTRSFFPEIDRFIAANPQDEQAMAQSLRALGAEALQKPVNDITNRLLNIWDVMSHPVRYARKYYVTIPHVFLLFVASPFLVRRRDAWTVAYTVFAGFLVLASGHQTRYLMPIIPLAAAATAAVLAALYVLVKSRWSQWAAAGAVVVFIAYVSAYAGFNTLLELRSLWRASARGYFVGRDSALDMLARENSGNGIAGAAEFFRKRFADPPPSGVLMIVENRCFPIAQQCFGDHPTIFGQRWLAELMKAGADYNRLRKNLLRQGIRYILFTRDALPMARDQALQTITQDITLKDHHRRRMIWGLHHLYGFGQEYATIVYRTRRVAIYDIAQKRQSFSHTPVTLTRFSVPLVPNTPLCDVRIYSLAGFLNQIRQLQKIGDQSAFRADSWAPK